MSFIKFAFIHVHSLVSLGIAPILSFMFWLASAKVYNEFQMGNALTIIGASIIISIITRFGLDEGAKRFIPEYKTSISSLISNLSNKFTFLTIITSLTLFYFVLYLPGKIDIYELILIVLLAPSINFHYFYNGIFIGQGKFKLLLYKNSLNGLFKIFFVFAFANLQLGIIFAWLVGNLLSNLYAFFMDNHGYISFNHIFTRVTDPLCLSLLRYSFVTSSIILVNALVPNLLPLILSHNIELNYLAYIFIPWSIITALLFIPESISNVFLIRTLNKDSELKIMDLSKNLGISFLVLLPIIIILFFFGKNILNIYGLNYGLIASKYLLKLIPSYIFLSLNSILGIILKIKLQFRAIVIGNIFPVIAVFIYSIFFLQDISDIMNIFDYYLITLILSNFYILLKIKPFLK